MRQILFIWVMATTSDALGREFPYLYRSAHFLGRGDTGIGDADNEDALFYNPAGLSQGKGIFKKIVIANPMIEISTATRDLAQKIAVQENSATDALRQQIGNPQHAGINAFSGIILRRAAIGAFVHNSTTVLVSKDPSLGALETVTGDAVADAGLVLGIAEDYFDQQLHVGVTAKYIQRTQAYIVANSTEAERVQELRADEFAMTGRGTGVDVGFMFKLGGRMDTSFGLTIQDMGQTELRPTKSTTLSPEERPLKPIKQTVNFGFAFGPEVQLSRFRFLGDLRDITNAYDESIYKRIHLGVELAIGETLGFTTGLNQGYPTIGFYVDLPTLRIDFGSYTEETGEKVGDRPDPRAYIRIATGI